MIDKKAIQSACLFGLVTSVVSATLAAGIFSVWDWVENPGGIFHDATGTNWNFVYDTAISWFIPTLLQSFVPATLLHFLVVRIISFIKTR